MACASAGFAVSLRIGLIFGAGAVESGKRKTGRVDADDLGKSLQRHFQAPGIVDLRHQAEIGQRDLVAAGIGRGPDQRFKRLEAGDDPVMVPGIDRALLLTASRSSGSAAD